MYFLYGYGHVDYFDVYGHLLRGQFCLLLNVYTLHLCCKRAPRFETDLWEDMSLHQPRVVKQDAKSKTRLHSGCIFIGSFLRDIYVLQQLLCRTPALRSASSSEVLSNRCGDCCYWHLLTSVGIFIDLEIK